MDIILDIAIVLILIVFAWSGARKGLILTVLSVAGLVAAFLGARFVSATFYEPVSDIIQPGIYQKFEEMEDQLLRGAEISIDLDGSVEILVDTLREQELFPGLVDLLETAIADDTYIPDKDHSTAESLSIFLAELLAKAGLFVVSFLVILLVWFLITKALDLTFKLPILKVINVGGGLILGLVKGVVIVIVLVWIAQLLSWLPAQPTTPFLRLFTLDGITQLLNKLVV